MLKKTRFWRISEQLDEHHEELRANGELTCKVCGLLLVTPIRDCSEGRKK